MKGLYQNKDTLHKSSSTIFENFELQIWDCYSWIIIIIWATFLMSSIHTALYVQYSPVLDLSSAISKIFLIFLK